MKPITVDSNPDLCANLLFKLGDEVLITLNESSYHGNVTWKLAHVIERHHIGGYKCCTNDTGSTEVITLQNALTMMELRRTEFSTSIERLLYHARFDSVENLGTIVSQCGMDLEIVGPLLLHEAARISNIDIFVWLHGVKNVDFTSVNSRGENALMTAIKNNEGWFFDFLLKMNLSTQSHFLPQMIQHRDNMGHSVFHYIASCGNKHILQCLTSHYATRDTLFTVHSTWETKRNTVALAVNEAADSSGALSCANV